jgi:hypothetical protein
LKKVKRHEVQVMKMKQKYAGLLCALFISAALLITGCSTDTESADGGSILAGVVSSVSASGSTLLSGITGKVSDSSGLLPVSGAAVAIEGLPTAYTDSAGNFRILGIDLDSLGSSTTTTTTAASTATGDTIVESYTAEVSVSAKGYTGIKMTIKLLRGKNISFEARLEKIEAAVLTGMVLDNTSRLAVVDASVAVSGASSMTTGSGDSGTYRVEGLEPGVYYINVSAADYTSKVFGVTLESGLNRIDLEIDKKGVTDSRLYGKIVDSRDSSPVEGALIQINSNSVYSGKASENQVSGYYSLENLTPGFHYVSASADDYLTRLVGITIESGSNLLDIALTSEVYNGDIRADLVGTVIGSDLKLRSGVEVIVGAYRESPVEYRAVTGDEGWYQIHGIPIGTYTVTATISGVTYEPDIVLENVEIKRELNVLNLRFSAEEEE